TNSIANGVTMSVVNVLQHPEFDTLSLHDALPISPRLCSMIPGNGLWTSDIADQHVCGSRMTIVPLRFDERVIYQKSRALQILSLDRKSTRLNSSHRTSSYAVSCLKKQKPKIANMV